MRRRRGNLITTTNCHIDCSNRFVAQIFVNATAGVSVAACLSVLVHLGGTMVSGVVRHVLSLVDASGKELQKKPK